MCNRIIQVSPTPIYHLPNNNHIDCPPIPIQPPPPPLPHTHTAFPLRDAFLTPFRVWYRHPNWQIRAYCGLGVPVSTLSQLFTQCLKVRSTISYKKPFLTVTKTTTRQVVDRGFTAVSYRISDRSCKYR